MTDTQIGVGIIGVEPGRSWSAVAHIPALRSLPQYRLAALSTRRQESADAAARAYGIEHAFGNHQALVSHPGPARIEFRCATPEPRTERASSRTTNRPGATRARENPYGSLPRLAVRHTTTRYRSCRYSSRRRVGKCTVMLPVAPMPSRISLEIIGLSTDTMTSLQ